MSTPPDSPIDPSGLWPSKLPQVFSDDDEEDSVTVSSDGEHGSSAQEFYGVKSDEDISEGVDNDTNDGNDDSDDGKNGDNDSSDDGEDDYNEDGEDSDNNASGPPSNTVVWMT
ncbi:prostatic spermine-binding protein-like [Setaria italica]|uniref:prostatic spermine-binding protein-like n=1 Tax=Setaria italica TaxID=4555 RepID=UPI0006469E6C|nr:prostatic spermine-binding protein-like [Setaria italica]